MVGTAVGAHKQFSRIRGLATGAMVMVIAFTVLAGRAGAKLAPSADLPAKYASDQVHEVARVVLRILGRDRRHIGELFLTEMSGPDAPGPPYPRCIRRHPPGDRVASFDLNYHPLDMFHGTAPAVHVTLAGPTGRVMTVENHMRPNGTWTCAAARWLYLSKEPPGWQLVYGLALPAPTHSKLRILKLHVDGKALQVRLGKVYSIKLR
jgi:hypothetical protein